VPCPEKEINRAIFGAGMGLERADYVYSSKTCLNEHVAHAARNRSTTCCGRVGREVEFSGTRRSGPTVLSWSRVQAREAPKVLLAKVIIAACGMESSLVATAGAVTWTKTRGNGVSSGAAQNFGGVCWRNMGRLG
jgi:hypothetical protein